ncbi:MAG: (Fe-S)-binding protein [Dehalococcoidales bacterium]|nr:(Fe-S)-binding protein [Dehalococcoidales bacterium]
MSPVSMTYWGISGYVIFWVFFALAVGLFLRRIYQLGRYLSLGRGEGGFGHIARRLLSTAVSVLGQWCQLKNLTIKNRASLGHVFMAWGFFIYIPFYLLFIIIGGGFGLSETMENTSFFFYYAWVMDIVAPFIILGALWGIIRRYIVRPPRLEGEQTIEALVILVTVFIHPMTHLFKEATAMALGYAPVGLGTSLPPISSALSQLFANASPSSVQMANTAFFWTHWGFVLFVLVFIAYSRYLHMIASIFNVLLQSPPPKGALRPIDLETAETFGASKITDFTWKQLLDLYSCVIYGQCQEVCPATASGKPLNPKKLIDDLKKHLLEEGPGLLKGKKDASANPGKAMIGEVITEDVIWACTTCRACQQVCPVSVEHINKIIDMRRNLVMEQASIPETAEGALRSIEDRGHPWRGTTLSRTDWAEGLGIKTLAEDRDIDILFWVGCTYALEERSTRVAQAMAKLLKLAGINFGILGAEESCCGEPARRLGNEYLFQMQAEKNIELLKGYGVKRIVTACPHGYNTIKNEYPQFGGEFEVIHHTELISQLIKEGRLKIKKGLSELVTYHDPCYLGRYNDIYQPPRQIIRSIPDIKMVEMEQNRDNSFCCGGGGGHMWLEERTGRRINEMRTEQAMETKAQIVVTACSFCLQMFDDGIKAKAAEEQLRVMDIAELVAAQVEE